jgi:ubiquinone/menaquinone biosynthesis C-methylase UbiE
MTEKKREMNQTWEEKSVEWAKTALATVSKDDVPNQLLIELASIRAGDTVLDFASGTGEPAISIALHVGRTGHVIATDVTPNMLKAARQRADRLDLKNMSFKICKMEELPFENHSFDAVTCRFGVMHAADPLAALREARRVLKLGKKAACMIHGPTESNTLWATVHMVAPDFLRIDDSKRVERHFKFSKGNELAELFRIAGFRDIGEKELCRKDVRNEGERFWTQLLSRDYGNVIDALDETCKTELYDRMAAAFQKYRKADAYELLASQRVIFGTAS